MKRIIYLIICFHFISCLSTPNIIDYSQKGDVDGVRERILKGEDVNLEEWGDTPLMVAIENGHSEVVRELVKSGAKIEDVNWKVTPLYVAARDGKLEIVKILVNKGATPYYYNNNRIDRIHFNCDSRLLYSHVDYYIYHSPYTIAVINKKYDVVEYFLKSKFSIENSGSYARKKICRGNLQPSCMLDPFSIKFECSTNASDEQCSAFSYSPFGWAIISGDDKMIKLFLGRKEINKAIQSEIDQVSHKRGDTELAIEYDIKYMTKVGEYGFITSDGRSPSESSIKRLWIYGRRNIRYSNSEEKSIDPPLPGSSELRTKFYILCSQRVTGLMRSCSPQNSLRYMAKQGSAIRYEGTCGCQYGPNQIPYEVRVMAFWSNGRWL